jgi:hypothetical protein
MVRLHGSVEDCFRFLASAVAAKSKRVLMLPGTDTNLLSNVSHNVWERIQVLLNLYDQEGKVKASSFEPTDWDEMNDGKITAYPTISCSPGYCGREGDEIGRAARKYGSLIMKMCHAKHGFDYHVVPCQGTGTEAGLTGRPHSFICAAFPSVVNVPNPEAKKQKIGIPIDADVVQQAFKQYMELYSGTSFITVAPSQ